MKPIVLLLCFIVFQTTGQIHVHEEPLHHPVLNKSGARILDVIAHPGDTSLIHQHANNYCYVTVQGGAVWLESPGEKGRIAQLPAGFIGGYYENPSAPLVHRFANLSSETIRLIAVENLSSLGDPNDSITSNKQNEEVITNNPYFLVTKILISANESLEIRPNWPGVIVNLESKDLNYSLNEKEAQLKQWVWMDAYPNLSVHNHLDEPAWIVVVKVKSKK